ncbi:MAG: response regulator [Clostridiaceae bacterium]
MYKVLVVDDEKLVRKGIVFGIDWAALDCMVIAEAKNGNEGIEAVEKYNPDLIITDIKMPQMDGIEMLRKIRASSNNIHVIFLTAYSDFEYAQNAIRLSAVDYLLKPFEDGDLEKVVTKVCKMIQNERKQKRKENEVHINLVLKVGDKSKYVMDALSYISEHYGDDDLCIRKIADQVGISEGRLSHVFKKETEYSVGTYIKRYRIRKAIKLLRSGKYKVYEVTYMVGYRDITYFSTTFKKITGVSPSDYRQRSLE